MSAPGWYPDPAGSNGYRYWDGNSWTNQTSDGSAGGGHGSGADGGGSGRNRTWIWFTVALVVIAAVIVALLWRPAALFPETPEDTNSARPSGSQWNELEPTETPTDPDELGPGDLVDCPRNSDDDRSDIAADGRMHGGGLSFEARTDWRSSPVYMPWIYDHNSQTREIVFGWQSNLSVGTVKKEEGFTSPRQAAESIMACMSSSSLFEDFSGREDLLNEDFELQGKRGWRITANVRVDDFGDGIEGDVVDIIVLDLGDAETFSIFISCATIGHEENLQEVAEATATLRVD
ncbi:hypothetical protein GCM10028820_18980 [Tessaracoccus terricola]